MVASLTRSEPGAASLSSFPYVVDLPEIVQNLYGYYFAPLLPKPVDEHSHSLRSCIHCSLLLTTVKSLLGSASTCTIEQVSVALHNACLTVGPALFVSFDSLSAITAPLAAAAACSSQTDRSN